jgi:hypothetical protein
MSQKIYAIKWREQTVYGYWREKKTSVDLPPEIMNMIIGELSLLTYNIAIFQHVCKDWYYGLDYLNKIRNINKIKLNTCKRCCSTGLLCEKYCIGGCLLYCPMYNCGKYHVEKRVIYRSSKIYEEFEVCDECSMILCPKLVYQNNIKISIDL